MHICFISYEYPPDTGIGGIATYVYQVAKAFSAKGIQTEVICASPLHSGTHRENEWLHVTKIKCGHINDFRKLSPAIAAQRHQLRPFDMIEVPEYGAEGLFIKEKLPDVPLVIKLHTPKYLIKELNDFYYDQTFIRKIKRSAGLVYDKNKDPEYKAIQLADHILSPSLSLKKIVAAKWGIAKEKILHAPNPYFPLPALLNSPVTAAEKNILYIGRLETRKGVYNLAKAIPFVLKKNPEATFTFLGKDSRGPFRERSMKEVMLHEIGDARRQVTFIDHVPLTEIPSHLATAGICVFPSLWENFPNVCLEAMSAGKAIIASSEGGMKDMLEDIQGGSLVNPHDVKEIGEQICHWLANPSERIMAGQRNREKAGSYYGDRLINELIAMYQCFSNH